MANKALTGFSETGRGFVGKYNISIEPCKSNGRHRVKFDLCAGDERLSELKIATWRKCVGYDDVADKLQAIKPGVYLYVEGWIQTSIRYDSDGRPIFALGRPVTDEHIILQKAEILNYQPSQMPLESLITK
jgi:hypothetical protein